MTRNIALTGMMGTGKTTVADLIAARLGREVVDTDQQVERVAGKGILNIFHEDGEPAFRAFERAAVLAACERDDLVVALGGGAILDDASVAALRHSSFIVLLEAPLDVLRSRVEGRIGRPLLQDTRADLVRIAGERRHRYHEVADAVVAATDLPTEVAMSVLAETARVEGVLTSSEREAIA